tara:strand:+ start:681 stop:920 length:240 start_codon:yes stop_codon:yes gene_type:complete
MNKFSSPFMARSPLNKNEVDLGIVKTKRHMVPNKYKEGSLVDEDDLEKSTGKKESGQTFSKTKKDKNGNSYVTRLEREK